jgi:hypothetical protein
MAGSKELSRPLKMQVKPDFMGEPEEDAFTKRVRRQELVTEKLEEVYQKLKEDRVEGIGRWRKPPEVARAVAESKWAIEALVAEGFTELQPVLEQFRERLGRLGRTTKAELIRKMLLPGTSDEQAAEIIRDLGELLEPVEVGRLRTLLGRAGGG